MMLKEYIDITKDIEPDLANYEVVLATTIVDGVPSNDGVTRRNIYKCQYDDVGPELHLFPSFGDANNTPFKVPDILNTQTDNPANIELMGVERKMDLPKGRSAYTTVPIIGALWYEEKGELWLLQSPQEQWPQEWFA